MKEKHSGLVLRTLRDGEGRSKMFCLIVLSLSNLHNQWSIVCGGVEEIGVGFQQRRMTGSKVCKEDHTLSIAIDFAIFRPGETCHTLRCPRISWWWICECSTDEESYGCVGDGSKRIAGGWFGFGVCGLITGDFFVAWHSWEGCRTRSRVDE